MTRLNVKPFISLFLSIFYQYFITARKRSLWRLCFYRCLSFILFTGGACMVIWGGWHAWFYLGGCVILFGGVGMCGFIQGGMRGFIRGVLGFIRGVCVVLFGGHVWFYLGGMRGFIWGHAWFYLGGCAWFYSGGVRGFIQGGMRGFIRGGMHGFIRGGGHAWFYSGGGHAWFFQFFRIQWDTVNERAVRILLECILVLKVHFISSVYFKRINFERNGCQI